ncbi:helix-turn-helix domain-containing protein [Streptosporangium oxazolinicum]|uniref:helix-turn-helix domain-containing protein n=1 Tax=Streptosporangium oxazolinicum TaxID=909287 RepID=UPI0031EDBEDC
MGPTGRDRSVEVRERCWNPPKSAESHLAEQGVPIERIAARCGFAASGALSSAFLRHTGVRPSTYRKN